MYHEVIRFHIAPYLYYSDINECLKEPPVYEDPCSMPNEECVNGPGNFSCECVKGYMRSDAHKDCENIALNSIKSEVSCYSTKKCLEIICNIT